MDSFFVRELSTGDIEQQILRFAGGREYEIVSLIPTLSPDLSILVVARAGSPLVSCPSRFGSSASIRTLVGDAGSIERAINSYVADYVVSVVGVSLESIDETTETPRYAAIVRLAVPGTDGSESAEDILTSLLTVDGAGSGVDSDLMDGQHGSYYQNADNLNAGTVALARLPVGSGNGLDADLLDGQHSSYYLDVGNFNAGVISLLRLPLGSGNGIDSDLLDGHHGSYYTDASNLDAGTVPLLRLPTGSGNGLDADTLDGNHSADIVNAAAAVVVDDAPIGLNTLKKIASSLNDNTGIAAELLARIDAAQQKNLVYNYDFRYYSNQLSTISYWYNYLHPDGWVFTDSGTDELVGYDTTAGCCKIQTSSNGSGTRSFSQALHEFVNWGALLKGSTVILKAFVKGTGATVRLTDGVTSQTSSLQNTGTVEEITLQLEISSSATELTVSIESSVASNAIEIYRVYANRGTYAIETLPCIIQGVIGELKSYDATEIPPAGELLVQSVELPTGYTRLNSYLYGKFGTGSNGRSKLDDALGRFERNWGGAAGTNDPDYATRTTRGDGTTGSHVGTKQDSALGTHRHLIVYVGDYNTSTVNSSMPIATNSSEGDNTEYELDSNSTAGLECTGGRSSLPVEGTYSSETRSINRAILKTIKWC